MPRLLNICIQGILATAAISVPFIAGAQTINIGAASTQAAYDSQRNYIYVPIPSGNRIETVDLNTNTVVASFPTGGGPAGVDVNAAKTQICVTNQTGKTVQTFNIDTRTQASTYNVGGITDHQPGECAFTSTGKVTFGFVNNGAFSGPSATTKQIHQWDPVANTMTTFGFALQEPHYIRRSADYQTIGAFEWNKNPARGVLYNSGTTQVSTNSSVPTDFSGSVPFNPGYNSMALNDDGTVVFAGKATYDRQFALVSNLPTYAAPIFLSDGTVLALSNASGNTYTGYTRMNAQTGAVLTTGVLPTTVAGLPFSFLLRTTHSSTSAGVERIAVIDRTNQRVVLFNVTIFVPAAAQDWTLFE